MANPRAGLIAKVLLVSAGVMAALGVYFLLVLHNTMIGAVLLVVAIGDVAIALVFSSRLR